MTDMKNFPRITMGVAAAALAALLLCPVRLSASAASAAPAAPASAAESGAPKMSAVYLVLLKKGPVWTATPTEESKGIQAAHMENIVALWKAGKMIIAGPLGDDGEIRGIFVLEAASLDEARELAASDPAIKAGRLVAEIHPWWIERKALPVAGSYCQADGAK